MTRSVVPYLSDKTLEAAFNGQARTRRPSASTVVAARARPPRGPRAGPSPPTTAGRNGLRATTDRRCGRQAAQAELVSVYSNTNVVGTLGAPSSRAGRSSGDRE